VKIVATSSCGTVHFDSETGIVLEIYGNSYLQNISKFDVAEWRHHYKGKTMPQFIDILDLGHWDKSESYYEAAEHGWRKETEQLRKGVDIEEITTTILKPIKPSPDWIETHHEIVAAITISLYKDEETTFRQVNETQGTGGIWELAETLTDEFQSIHDGREWDGEFYDEIESFINQKSIIK